MTCNNSDGYARGSFFALLLIIAGALLFLDNLSVLPVEDIRAYWPAWLIVWGFSIVYYKRTAHSAIWALTLIAAGVLLILGNLHILHVTAGILWPLFLIAAGAMMLVRPIYPAEWKERLQRRRRSHFAAQSGTSTFHGDRLDESAVFSSLNRSVESQNFEGGKLDSVFASIEVDMTQAAISSPTHTAVLEANSVFGGIEIRVPRTWKVIMKSTAVFGGCEDKTVPPRPEPGFPLTTLVVTGGAVFGGISISN
jgi:predicted membrane protein